jgi:hypothetical protein
MALRFRSRRIKTRVRQFTDSEMSSSTKDWLRRAAGFCFISISLIAYMFLFPRLYESIGKTATLLLLVLVIFVCKYVFEFLVYGSIGKEKH